MTTKRLGILGGMGTAAGLDLAQHVLRASWNSGAKKDSDFPDFLLHNLPFTSTDLFGIVNRDEVWTQVVQSVNGLALAGCNVIVIACNTVQCFHADLQRGLPNATLVNNIEAAADLAKGFSTVGVLCSKTCKRLGLFDEALARRDIKVVNTNDHEQNFLDEVIAAAITGTLYSRHQNWMVSLSALMADRGAERVILGCTELPLAQPARGRYDFIDAGRAAIDVALKLLI